MDTGGDNNNDPPVGQTTTNNTIPPAATPINVAAASNNSGNDTKYAMSAPPSPAKDAASVARRRLAVGSAQSESEKDARIRLLQTELRTIAAERDAERVNHEQLLSSADSRYQSTLHEHTLLQSRADRASSSLTQSQEALDKLRADYETLRRSVADKDVAVSERQSELTSLSGDRRRLLESNSKQQIEIDRLTRDVSSYSDKTVELSNKIAELQSRLSDADAERLPLQFKLSKLEQEKEISTKHQQFLEKDLAAKSAELIALKRESSSRIAELEGSLSSAEAELKAIKAQLTSTQGARERIDAALAVKIEEVRELETRRISETKSLSHELTLARQLTDLYKRAAEEEKKRVTEIQREHERLSDQLAETSESHKRALQKLSADLKSEREKVVELTAEREKFMGELADEKERSRAMLSAPSDDESVRALPPLSPRSPAAIGSSSFAHHTSPLSSSVNGTSTADHYQRLRIAEQEFASEKKKNREMSAYIKQIQREVSERAPVIQNQRHQYHRMLQSHQQLSTRLQEASHVYEQLRSEYSLSEKRNRELGDERDKIKQEAYDLARQVRALLKSHVDDRAAAPSSYGNDNGANEVISTHLVTVHNIEELHDQNMKLRQVARDLAARHEELQHERDDAIRDRERLGPQMEEKLREADRLIDEGKAERSRLEAKLEAVMQRANLKDATERFDTAAAANDDRDIIGSDSKDSNESLTGSGGSDAYALTSKLGSTPSRGVTTLSRSSSHVAASPMMSPLMVAPSRAVKELERVTIEFKELQEQFSIYRREKDSNEAQYSRSLETSRRDATSCRIDVANAQAEVKSLSERYKLLYDNTMLQKAELDHLRAKNAEFSASITKHQESLRESRLSLQSSDDQLRLLRAELTTAKAESALARRSEERLLQDNGELQLAKSRQDKLLSSLQVLQSSFEARDVDARKLLVKEKEDMRIEWVTLKKTVDEERRSWMDMERLRAQQSEDMRTRSEVTEKKYHEAREEIIRLTAGHEHATQRVKELEHSLKILQDQLDALLAQRGADKSAAASTHGTTADFSGRAFSTLGKEKQLELELSRALEENAQLNEQVTKGGVREHELTTIIASTEEQLRAITAASKTYKGRAEIELARSADDRTRALERITQLQSVVRQSEVESAQLREAMETKIQELTDSLTSLQATNASLTSSMNGVQKREQQLLDDVRTHATLAREAQDQYQRELIAHADNVKLLAAAHHDVTSLEAQVAASRTRIAELTNEVARLTLAASRHDETVQERISDLESKRTDLARQNELLLSQLESVTLQARRAQDEASLTTSSSFLSTLRDNASSDDKTSDTSSAAVAAASVASDKEVKDLREIVRYMRREKEILSVELESARQEQISARAAVAHHQARVNELQQQMAAEIKAAALNVHSATEQSAITQQLNQLNLLQESNAMLREENIRAQARAGEADKKVSSLQSQLEPLRKQLEALGSEKDALENDKKLLSAENIRWKERNQKLLDKYQQIDPEVHRQLGQQYEECKAAKDVVDTQLASLTTLHAACGEELKKVSESRDKLKKAASHWKTRFESEEKTRKSIEERVIAADERATSLSTQLHDLETKMASGATNATVQTRALQQAADARRAAETRVERMTVTLRDANRILHVKQDEVTSLTRQVREAKNDATSAASTRATAAAASIAAEEKIRREAEARLNVVKSALETKVRTLEENKKKLAADLLQEKKQVEVLNGQLSAKNAQLVAAINAAAASNAAAAAVVPSPVVTPTTPSIASPVAATPGVGSEVAPVVPAKVRTLRRPSVVGTTTAAAAAPVAGAPPVVTPTPPVVPAKKTLKRALPSTPVAASVTPVAVDTSAVAPAAPAALVVASSSDVEETSNDNTKKARVTSPVPVVAAVEPVAVVAAPVIEPVVSLPPAPVVTPVIAAPTSILVSPVSSSPALSSSGNDKKSFIADSLMVGTAPISITPLSSLAAFPSFGGASLSGAPLLSSSSAPAFRSSYAAAATSFGSGPAFGIIANSAPAFGSSLSSPSSLSSNQSLFGSSTNTSSLFGSGGSIAFPSFAASPFGSSSSSSLSSTSASSSISAGVFAAFSTSSSLPSFAGTPAGATPSSSLWSTNNISTPAPIVAPGAAAAPALSSGAYGESKRSGSPILPASSSIVEPIAAVVATVESDAPAAAVSGEKRKLDADVTTEASSASSSSSDDTAIDDSSDVAMVTSPKRRRRASPVPVEEIATPATAPSSPVITSTAAPVAAQPTDDTHDDHKTDDASETTSAADDESSSTISHTDSEHVVASSSSSDVAAASNDTPSIASMDDESQMTMYDGDDDTPLTTTITATPSVAAAAAAANDNVAAADHDDTTGDDSNTPATSNNDSDNVSSHNDTPAAVAAVGDATVVASSTPSSLPDNDSEAMPPPEEDVAPAASSTTDDASLDTTE